MNRRARKKEDKKVDYEVDGLCRIIFHGKGTVDYLEEEAHC